MEIKRSEDYEEKSLRTGRVDAWLFETIERDLLPHLEAAINADDRDQSNAILLAVHTYFAGIQDGLTFNRSNPFGPDCPPLTEGSRVLYPVKK